MIRVLLVDDHLSFREPLAFMIEREPDIVVVAEAGSLAETRSALWDLSGRDEIDVAILDISLPDGEGVELVGDLRASHPGSAVLMLSAAKDEIRFVRAVEAGASGVMHKSVRVAAIIDAVRRLHAGKRILPTEEAVEVPGLTNEKRLERDRERAALARLTRREKEVLRVLVEGLPDKEIAERLGVSDRTVRTHMVNILAKLGLNSRLQALVFAVRHGIARIR